MKEEWREVSLALSRKYEKSALMLGKTLIVVIYGLDFLSKVQSLRVSMKKPEDFSLWGLSFLCCR